MANKQNNDSTAHEHSKRKPDRMLFSGFSKSMNEFDE